MNHTLFIPHKDLLEEATVPAFKSESEMRMCWDGELDMAINRLKNRVFENLELYRLDLSMHRQVWAERTIQPPQLQLRILAASVYEFLRYKRIWSKPKAKQDTDRLMELVRRNGSHMMMANTVLNGPETYTRLQPALEKSLSELDIEGGTQQVILDLATPRRDNLLSEFNMMAWEELQEADLEERPSLATPLGKRLPTAPFCTITGLWLPTGRSAHRAQLHRYLQNSVDLCHRKIRVS